jgi:hypothetical protein
VCVDDKSVNVLSKEELLPYDEDEANRETLETAVNMMREQEDWLVQHEVRLCGLAMETRKPNSPLQM